MEKLKSDVQQKQKQKQKRHCEAPLEQREVGGREPQQN